MVLVDTSVWIEHFRRGLPRLRAMLEATEVLCHAFVIGELACGNLGNRREILDLLAGLPGLDRASDEEVLRFIEAHRLYGKGLGLIDMHLLAACHSAGTALWTLDKRLAGTASGIGVSAH